MSESYNDQEHFNLNPETLEYQDPDEVGVTLWSALRPCRELTGRSFDNSSNKWIDWIPPTESNPECGMRIYEPGRLFGRREFAQIVLSIIGSDYEISVWRKRHDGITLFSTRNDMPVLSPCARLTAAVGQMYDLTKFIEQLTRSQTLRENFPPEWIGDSWTTLLQIQLSRK